MKNKYFALIVPILLLVASCGSDKSCKVTIEASDSTISTNTYTVFEFLDKTGNIVEKNEFPYLVKTYDLYSRIDEYLVIDIRSAEEYAKGHIEGAYNVQRDSLKFFFDNEISASAYPKIAIVGDYGPLSLYVSTLLRLAGYNAFALKYGMGAWNEKFADNISKYVSNQYGSIAETDNNVKSRLGDMPELISDNILEFIDNRAFELIAEDFSVLNVSPQEVMDNPDNYFVMAYWPEDIYDAGHFPGSVRYQPREDLDPDRYLGTLPTDKKIVVYCYTGHQAAAIVAYLKLVGYDACSFMYGANSFMNVKLKDVAPGVAISDVNNLTSTYPIIEGPYRTAKGPANVDNSSSQAAPPPIIPVQQNNTQGNDGGCG